MAATAAKKTAVSKKAAPTPPEPVELLFTLLKDKETKGTYRWAEEEAEDGSVVIGQAYMRKWYFEQTGFVPDENTTLSITVQIDQNVPE